MAGAGRRLAGALVAGAGSGGRRLELGQEGFNGRGDGGQDLSGSRAVQVMKMPIGHAVGLGRKVALQVGAVLGFLERDDAAGTGEIRGGQGMAFRGGVMKRNAACLQLVLRGR